MHKRVREITVMLKVSGDGKPLGKRWVQNFLKHDPRVATLLGSPIRGAQPENTDMFCENFNSTRSRTNVQ